MNDLQDQLRELLARGEREEAIRLMGRHGLGSYGLPVISNEYRLSGIERSQRRKIRWGHCCLCGVFFDHHKGLGLVCNDHYHLVEHSLQALNYAVAIEKVIAASRDASWSPKRRLYEGFVRIEWRNTALDMIHYATDRYLDSLVSVDGGSEHISRTSQNASKAFQAYYGSLSSIEDERP